MYYISEGRIVQKIDCVYKDGTITFVTNHFSTYSVVSETDEVSSSDSGMDIGLIVGAAVGIIAIIAAAAFIVVRKH